MMPLLRAARASDLDAIYAMAKATGGGFTNLPPDRGKLARKLAAAEAAFARDGTGQGTDSFLFVLEDAASGAVRGTCQVFSQVGIDEPFYSYRIDATERFSADLGRTVRSELLTLCTDHRGSSEVGGLFLMDDARSSGAGTLLARSRYLFIRMHRSRFADRTLAELRGIVDADGQSPFWDGVGGRFLGMSFRDADAFNAVNGTRTIAELIPRVAVPRCLLDEGAQRAFGSPHDSGRPAMRMLAAEGFIAGRYVDVFDGGPTMTAATDAIATVREGEDAEVIAVGTADDAAPAIVATGRLGSFRATFGAVAKTSGGITIDAAAADRLGIAPGDRVTHVAQRSPDRTRDRAATGLTEGTNR